MQPIIVLGFWPAVPVAGYWLLRATRGATPGPGRIETVGLTIALGVVVWSPALLLLLVVHAYSPGLVGLLGWLVVAGFVAWWLRDPRRASLRPSFDDGGLDAWDLVLAAGLLCAAVLYLGFSGEFVIGGRDENSYALHGLWIAEHRRLDIPYPWPTELHSTFYDAFLRFSGTFRTEPTMTPAFGHVLPVWLAQAFSSFGYEGMFRLNAIFSLAAVLVFLGLARSVIAKPFTVVAALVVALNPAQLWISRTPLTEILTQLLLWAALWLLVMALTRRSQMPARIAGLTLGAAVLVRIDMLVIVPLVVLAHLGTSLIEDERESSRPVWAALYQVGIPSVSLAIGYYVAFSRPYLVELIPQLMQVAALTAASMGLLFIGTRAPLRVRLMRMVTSHRFLVAAGCVLAGGTTYAYFIRPIDQPFLLFSDAQVMLAGKRTYAEDSLPNLAAYLTPVVVLGGVIGWFAVLWTAIRTRARWWMPLLLIAGGFSFLYLANPSVTPAHFWGIRRFVPAVIPAFVGFAAMGSWLVLRSRPAVWSAAFCAAVLVLFGAFTLQAFRPFLFVSEHNGYREQLASMAEALPDDEIVLAINGERWWKPFYFVFGKKVVDLSLTSSIGSSVFTNWISDELEAGRRPTVLGLGTELPVPGLRYERVKTTVLERLQHRGVPRPLPVEIARDPAEITAFKILGVDETYAFRDINLASGLTWDLTRTGFHDPEIYQGAPVAWTNGSGKVSFPVRGDPPAEVTVSIRGSAVEGGMLAALVNGVELYRGQVPGEGLQLTLPMRGVPVGDRIEIELASDARVESRDVPIDGSLYRRQTVERTIGVAVESLEIADAACDYRRRPSARRTCSASRRPISPVTTNRAIPTSAAST